MSVKERLSDRIVRFPIKSIYVIGNVDTGTFIILNEEGNDLINKIERNEVINYKKLSENLKQLITVGRQLEIIKDNDNEIMANERIQSAYLHVTNKCNLHCLGCYSNSDTRNTCEDLTIDKIQNELDALKRLGVENLVISGGEPFLRKDIVDILKYAKENCKFSRITLGTNGLFATEQILIEIKPYVDDLKLSMDTFDDNHFFIRDKGIHNAVFNSLQIMKRLGMPVTILPTLSSKNIDYIQFYLNFAKENEVPISFSLLTCDTENKELAQLLPSAEQVERLYLTDDKIIINDMPLGLNNISIKIGCGVGKKIISVDEKGYVYPCHMLHYSDLCYGNILEKENVLTSEICKKFFDYSVVQNDKCKKCEYKFFCGGGCFARGYYKKKNFDEVDNLCNVYYKYFDNLFSKFCGR